MDKTAIRGGVPVACAVSELATPDSAHVSTLPLGSSTDKATRECARTALHLTVAALRSRAGRFLKVLPRAPGFRDKGFHAVLAILRGQVYGCKDTKRTSPPRK